MLRETETKDGDSAIRLISINPTLRKQAEEMLPALEAAKAPASRQDIRAILIRAAPVYAIEDRSEGEWDVLLEAYLQALDGFSAYQIKDAFLRWNRGEDMKDPAMGQFYPKPSQLVHLAKKAKTEVWTAAWRAKQALEAQQPPKKVDQDEAAKVREGFAELLSSFSAKTIPEAVRPSLTPQQVAQRLRGYGDEEPVL